MLITPAELRSWLLDGDELALLDVREQGVFCREHLFHAACIPLSRLEAELPRLVPRSDTRMVLCDDGTSSLAIKAVLRATAMGWSNVSVLDGGTSAWRAAGFELYSGVNVPSKAFGEYVEHAYGTPRVSAADLSQMMSDGTDVVVLDARPVGEYHRMSIPTGIDCPGAELVHRGHGMTSDSDTLVVVNCAGRTRSIIGAQSLINAGLPNRVVALENGTMGWELAGFDVEIGQTRFAEKPSRESLEWSLAAADTVGIRFGVESIDHGTLALWQQDRSRTTVLLDVRTREEYESGHLPASRWAEGGQLVQATDEYIATRNTRLVLVDDDGVRATMTASWLRQLGWSDAVVLIDALSVPDTLETGPEASMVTPPAVPTISVEELAAAMDADDLVLLDLATSLDYRKKGHIPGAWWTVRSRLDEATRSLNQAGVATASIVITGFDESHTRFAYDDVVTEFPAADVTVLLGGTSAWVDHRLALDTGFNRPTTAPDDIWYKPYALQDGKPAVEEMQAYLTWEVALVDQVARDETVAFPTFA